MNARKEPVTTTLFQERRTGGQVLVLNFREGTYMEAVVPWEAKEERVEEVGLQGRRRPPPPRRQNNNITVANANANANEEEEVNGRVLEERVHMERNAGTETLKYREDDLDAKLKKMDFQKILRSVITHQDEETMKQEMISYEQEYMLFKPLSKGIKELVNIYRPDHKESDEVIELESEPLDLFGCFSCSTIFIPTGTEPTVITCSETHTVHCCLSKRSSREDDSDVKLKKVDIEKNLSSVIRDQDEETVKHEIILCEEEENMLFKILSKGKKERDEEEEVIELESERAVEKLDQHIVTRTYHLGQAPAPELEALQEQEPENEQSAKVQRDESLDLFGCFSCFSIFSPKGNGFNPFGIFRRQSSGKKEIISHQTSEIAANPSSNDHKVLTIDQQEEQLNKEIKELMDWVKELDNKDIQGTDHKMDKEPHEQNIRPRLSLQESVPPGETVMPYTEVVNGVITEPQGARDHAATSTDEVIPPGDVAINIDKESDDNIKQEGALSIKKPVGQIGEIPTIEDKTPEAWYSSTPTQRHWTKVKHILRYLRGTTDMSLFHSNGSKPQLIGYANADYLFDRYKSWLQTGFVFTHCNKATSWRSVQQTLTVTSSNHSEILAIHEASREYIWLRSTIQRVREKCGLSSFKGNPAILYENNAACITKIGGGYIKGDMTKHILPRFFYTHELQKSGDVDVQQIRSNKNLTNLFNKVLPIATFKKQAHNIGNATIQRSIMQRWGESLI